jgi:hypothetical protein
MTTSPRTSVALFTDDELDAFSRSDFDHESVPFLCAECGTIGGYYAAAMQAVSCPHCDCDAHPITAMVSDRPTHH